MEIEDYSTVLFKILCQGILDLLFNDLPCPEPDVLNKHHFHEKMISGTWDSLQADVWCFIILLVVLNHYVYL